MLAHRDRELGELLSRRGLLDPQRLRQLQVGAAASGVSLASRLEPEFGLPRMVWLAALADELGRELVVAPPLRLEPEVASLLPAALARKLGLVPWRDDGVRVAVLPLDPFGVPDHAELSFALGRDVVVCVADPDVVGALLREHYGAEAEGMAAASVAVSARVGAASIAGAEATELVSLSAQAPVVRYVNEVLEQAIRENASDIHFEPFERDCRVRCRIDGALREWPGPPAALSLAVVSRLKVLANLDIAEARVPQDGRIRLAVQGRAVELRISTLPTQYGESVVLRVLDGDRAATLRLDALGMAQPVLAELRQLIRRPGGMIVVTGPTGSGKTTTLYACLREINEAGAKLLTVEDPVEYELEGAIQVAVNPVAGLSFGAALRAFLRQDPDVVMVGEIRDLETAQVAIQAALTGHLVFSTLHTNDAAGAVTRLVDLGVEPYLVAASLEAVLAQRLVRRICPDCRCEQLPDAETLDRLGLGGFSPGGLQFFSGAGCPHCGQTGYRGRLGLYELLRIDDSMRECIVRGGGTQVLRNLARSRGMQSLRAGGLAAIAARDTTPEEVLKYT